MATSNHIISLRRHDLDNLRTFLTGLVTVHHTAIAYGGVGSWPFKSAACVGSSPLLFGFNAIDQSFFMGLFFWVSGRVSGQSLYRSSSPWALVKSKVMRLGLPAIGYTFLVQPIVRVMLLPRWETDSIKAYLSSYYSNISGVGGPLWYTGTLLIFDIFAALHWSLFRSRRPSKIQPETYEKFSKYGWVAVGVCSSLIRALIPLGTNVPVINLQPGYASQYIYAYVLGHLSYQCDEPRMISPFESYSTLVEGRPQAGPKHSDSRHSSKISLTTALTISALSFNLIFLPRFLDTPDWLSATEHQISGGLNLPTILYALWNEFSFVLLGPALMGYFERNYSKPAMSSTWNARFSYAAFLVHTPVSIAIELVLERLLFSNTRSNPCLNSRWWQTMGPVVMTASVGLGSAWASFVIGKKLLDWVPGLKRII